MAERSVPPIQDRLCGFNFLEPRRREGGGLVTPACDESCAFSLSYFWALTHCPFGSVTFTMTNLEILLVGQLSVDTCWWSHFGGGRRVTPEAQWTRPRNTLSGDLGALGRRFPMSPNRPPARERERKRTDRVGGLHGPKSMSPVQEMPRWAVSAGGTWPLKVGHKVYVLFFHLFFFYKIRSRFLVSKQLTSPDCCFGEST